MCGGGASGSSRCTEMVCSSVYFWIPWRPWRHPRPDRLKPPIDASTEVAQGPYVVVRERVQDLRPDPVIAIAGPVHDFAMTLADGRRVVGHDRDREWSVYVYGDDGRLLGYGSASTRLRALEQAGLSGDHAGEVLGRSGI